MLQLAVAKPGDCVEKAGVFVRVLLEEVAKGVGVEVNEKLAKTGGCDLERCLVDPVAVLFADKVESKLLPGADEFDSLPLSEPILLTAGFPIAEIIFIKAFAVRAESFDDFQVGDAVEEHSIDAVADWLREPGDFAVTTTAPAEEAGQGAGLREFG